jgi:hypothetical protein
LVKFSDDFTSSIKVTTAEEEAGVVPSTLPRNKQIDSKGSECWPMAVPACPWDYSQFGEVLAVGAGIEEKTGVISDPLPSNKHK